MGNEMGDQTVNSATKYNGRVDYAAIGDFNRNKGRADAVNAAHNVNSQYYTDKSSFRNRQQKSVQPQQKKGWLAKLGDAIASVADGLYDGAISVGKEVVNIATKVWDSLTGLFAKTDETSDKIDKAKANNDPDEAARLAREFMQKNLHVQGVKNMKNDEILRRYDEFRQRITYARQMVDSRQWTLQQGLDEVANAINGMAGLNVSSERKAKDVSEIQEDVKAMFISAPPDQVATCTPGLVKINEALNNLANSITDEATRNAVLAGLSQFNNDIAGIVADKILPAQNATQEDYLRAADFLDQICSLPIKMVENELTQKILDMIQENNQQNIQADNVAYQKSLLENKFQKLSMLRKAQDRKDDNRKDDKILAINKMNQKMFMAILSQDPDKVGKAKAAINYQEQKPPKVS